MCLSCDCGSIPVTYSDSSVAQEKRFSLGIPVSIRLFQWVVTWSIKLVWFLFSRVTIAVRDDPYWTSGKTV
jgi:hypothetical protein